MNHTLSDSQLEAMIKSAVNSSGPLPPDEKFSQLVSALRELQERRKADSEPAMYVMGMGRALDAETASTCKGAVDSWVGEWNLSRLPGQADYKTVPLYRHAQPAPIVLKDHQIRELVNQLRDIAIKYHAAGQLREQIARAVRSSMLQAGNCRENENSSTNNFREIAETSTNSPVIPDGYVMVPKEPTEEMNKAGWAAMNEHDAINPTYRAMLAAAPQDGPALDTVQSVVAVLDTWIPVSERMPIPGVDVLVAKEFFGPGDWRRKVGHVRHEDSGWNIYGASWTPTHWMPLPAAPQEVKGE